MVDFIHSVDRFGDGPLSRVTRGPLARRGSAVDEASLDAIQTVLRYFGRANIQIAQGVPLRFGHLLDQTEEGTFPPVEVFEKPTSTFDPSGSRNGTWTQRQLEDVGPYDRATFERKRPRIAVLCGAARG